MVNRTHFLNIAALFKADSFLLEERMIVFLNETFLFNLPFVVVKFLPPLVACERFPLDFVNVWRMLKETSKTYDT